jgi:serine/threonine protein kinase
MMANLRLLLRCVGEAVCVKGAKALCSMVPFGGVIYDIAEEAYKRLKKSATENEQREALAAAAQASADQVRGEAVAVAEEVAASQALPPEAHANLLAYLAQVPSVVRQTFKRPSDPHGNTVPASFSLKGPEQMLTLLPQRLPSLKAGDRVANWELVELLGAGGFGEVWLARHPSLHGLTAALKLCLDPAAASSLRHEAVLLDRVMQQGKHPGIVTLRQAYLDHEPLCLEYEYVNGGDLAALVGEWKRQGKVPRRQVNQMMHRLAEIVAHAHMLAPPIVHRDLKPANILIERSADNKIRLRVTDFGIGGIAAARLLHGTRCQTASQRDQLSTCLRGSYTPIYASPQQVKGEPPDPRDDVHALGVIWYQLLTGDLTAGLPADWVTVLRDLGQPQPLIEALGACVASRSDKRLPSAAALAERLATELDADRVLEAIPVEPEIPMAQEWTPPRPETHRPVKPHNTVRPRRAVTQRAVTQRAPREETLEVVPVEPVRHAPARGRRAPARSGNQVRHYRTTDLRLAQLRDHLQDWLHEEGFDTQCLKTDHGATLVQVRQQGGWRKLVGMETALNLVLEQTCEELVVEIGAGQWHDKVSAGVVSLFVLWPLAVTAAIGAWSQAKMPERIFAHIDHFLAAGREAPAQSGGLASDGVARLRDLAALRDQGILTEEEFQAQKARLLAG